VRLRLLALLGACCLGLTACPTQESAGCGQAPDDVLAAIEPELRTDGELRHATARSDGGRWFVSTELHEDDHDEHENGDILTFAADEAGSTDLVAVDEKAREHTSLPAADFHVDVEGGVESRGCTVLARDDAEAAAEED
jgi:hypothetical protein